MWWRNHSWIHGRGSGWIAFSVWSYNRASRACMFVASWTFIDEGQKRGGDSGDGVCATVADHHHLELVAAEIRYCRDNVKIETLSACLHSLSPISTNEECISAQPTQRPGTRPPPSPHPLSSKYPSTSPAIKTHPIPCPSCPHPSRSSPTDSPPPLHREKHPSPPPPPTKSCPPRRTPSPPRVRRRPKARRATLVPPSTSPSQSGLYSTRARPPARVATSPFQRG